MPYERKTYKWTDKDKHPMDCEPVTHLPIDQQIRRTLEWIGRLKITQGEGEGEPIRILPWQKDLLSRLLSTETSELGVSIARGNGKTTFLAMVCAAFLIGPLRRPRGHIYFVASTTAQALIALDHLIACLELQDYAHRFRVSHSSHLLGIRDVMTGSQVRVLSSRPKSAHGIQAAIILGDEPSQWEVNSRDAMYSALRTSLGKLPNSKFVALGTRPHEAGHWFSKLLLKPQSLNFAAPRFQEITNSEGETEYVEIPIDRLGDIELIRQANPGLDHFPELRKIILSEYQDALTEPSLMASYRALRLNQGTSDVAQNSIIDSEHVMNCEERWAELEETRKGAFVLGCDLGGGTSMTGAAAYWPLTGGAEFLAAFPADPDLQKRGHLDGVGDLYLRMETEQDLITTPGKTVDYSFFLNAAIERFGGRPKVITCDRYRSNDLRTALMKMGLGNVPIIWRGMGFRDGSEDIRSFRRAALEGKLAFAPSTLVRSGFAEARTISDPASNEKMCRATEGGRRRTARDDVVCAALLAVGHGYRDVQKTQRLRIAM